MPVIYMFNKQKSLEREPYASFRKKFGMLSEDLWGKEITIPIGTDKLEEFEDGFYNCDYAYQRNKMIKFTFAKQSPEQLGGEIKRESIFVRCTYSFEYDEEDTLERHLQRMKSFALRGDYYYIPNAEYLEFSYKVDKEIQMYVDAIVLDVKDIQQVCYSMINQFISIFSLDD